MFIKLKQCEVESYDICGRVICLSGDIEENPGPSYEENTNPEPSYEENTNPGPSYEENTNPGPSFEENTNSILKAHGGSLANSVSLFDIRLSDLNLTAIDVGGGADCFFRAVSHQLYGNPNNHFHIRTLGVHYLVQNPDHFIESNTERSWEGYLTNMSCQGTWADAIIVQAVANCLNLTIYIVESNESFAPLTVVQPINMTGDCRNIVIGHIGETHYVSTIAKTTNQFYYQVPTKFGQSIEGYKLCDNVDEKRRNYVKEYNQKTRVDAKSVKKTKSINQKRQT